MPGIIAKYIPEKSSIVKPIRQLNLSARLTRRQYRRALIRSYNILQIVVYYALALSASSARYYYIKRERNESIRTYLRYMTISQTIQIQCTYASASFVIDLTIGLKSNENKTNKKQQITTLLLESKHSKTTRLIATIEGLELIYIQIRTVDKKSPKQRELGPPTLVQYCMRYQLTLYLIERATGLILGRSLLHFFTFIHLYPNL